MPRSINRGFEFWNSTGMPQIFGSLGHRLERLADLAEIGVDIFAVEPRRVPFGDAVLGQEFEGDRARRRRRGRLETAGSLTSSPSLAAMVSSANRSRGFSAKMRNAMPMSAASTKLRFVGSLAHAIT